MNEEGRIYKLMKIKENELNSLIENKSELLAAHLNMKWGDELGDIFSLEDVPARYRKEVLVLLDALIRTARSNNVHTRSVL